MGIEHFFSSIEGNKITNFESAFTKKLEHQIDTKHLFIDFNSIVHVTSSQLVSDLNTIIYRLAKGHKDAKFITLVKQYDLSVNPKSTMDDIVSQLTSQNINWMVIDKVREYIFNMVQNYVTGNTLETLYIAVDGVPSKSKIVQQLQRRYMGGLVVEMKKRIFAKHENTLKRDTVRYQYEKHRISFDKRHISPGTEFMNQLHGVLNGPDFEVQLKELCPQLKTYVYSGVYEPGEGEKKIIDYLRSTSQTTSDYTIYSPDSDMTLLGLLLNTTDTHGKRISRLKLLRHNQQMGNYDIIDIDKLAANLHSYVNKTTKASQDSVVKDIVFILTVFGNDFLPRMESYSVKNDFNQLIDKYAEFRKKHHTPIITINKKHHQLNAQLFGKLIDVLAKNETKRLHNIYMQNHYHNYDRLKRVFNATADNFTEKMTVFLDSLNKFNYDIRYNVNNRNVNQEKMFQKWLSNGEFMEKMQKLTNMDGKVTRMDDDTMSNNEFIRKYSNYYHINGKFPLIGVTLRRFTRDLTNPSHTKNLEKNLNNIDPGLQITSYDREVYKMEHMLEEYAEKLNAKPLDLGYISVDTKSYTWKMENINKGIDRYYREFFNIQRSQTKQLDRIVESYLDGLMWVFDYYYNFVNPNENRSLASIWCYNHTKAPLLNQINEYLQRHKMTPNIFATQRVPRERFFNCLEHLIYSSPVSINMELIPKEYHKFIQKKINSGYYPDIHRIVREIMTHQTNDEVDCRGAIFLSKCNITAISKIPSFKEDEKFIKELRQIPISEPSSKRQGRYVHGLPNVKTVNYSDSIPLHQVKPKNKKTVKGGRLNALHTDYIHKRQQYLETRNPNHKEAYKLAKWLYIDHQIAYDSQ